jgi:hypothetical protein
VKRASEHHSDGTFSQVRTCYQAAYQSITMQHETISKYICVTVLWHPVFMLRCQVFFLCGQHIDASQGYVYFSSELHLHVTSWGHIHSFPGVEWLSNIRLMDLQEKSISSTCHKLRTYSFFSRGGVTFQYQANGLTRKVN